MRIKGKEEWNNGASVISGLFLISFPANDWPNPNATYCNPREIIPRHFSSFGSAVLKDLKWNKHTDRQPIALEDRCEIINLDQNDNNKHLA